MPDVFQPKKRSEVMAAIRSTGNKDTELRLLQLLKAGRVTGWRRHQKLPGKPDFVFRQHRLAVFIDGCFWHGCPKHGRQPGTNTAYWSPKLIRNKKRDRQVARVLRKLGWTVLRFWEHDLSSPEPLLSKIRSVLQENDPSPKELQSVKSKRAKK